MDKYYVWKSELKNFAYVYKRDALLATRNYSFKVMDRDYYGQVWFVLFDVAKSEIVREMYAS